MANFAPLNSEKHKNLKISNQLGLERIANQHIISANARDFAQLATSYPIMFIKDEEKFNTVNSVLQRFTIVCSKR